MTEAQGSLLHLLLIADTPADADMLHHYIAGWPEPSPMLVHADTAQAAYDRLAKGDIDVVMLAVQDASQNRLTERLQPIARLRQVSIGVTVLVLTGFEPDERIANQILQSANDYLVKDQLSPWSLMRSVKVAGKCQGLQRQLLDVLSASPDGTIVVDEDGRVLYVNHAGATMFGRQPTELQGELFGYPLANADLTELDFGADHTAEMRVANVEWSGSPAYLITLRDVTERKRQEQRLVYLAGHDDLTGLINRAHFSEELTIAIARAARKRSRLAMLFLDLDRFKPVNDTYGHDHGDALLKGVAQRLSKSCRAGEFVGRLGGDEFTLMAEDVKPGNEALIAERILKAFAEPFLLGEIKG